MCILRIMSFIVSHFIGRIGNVIIAQNMGRVRFSGQNDRNPELAIFAKKSAVQLELECLDISVQYRFSIIISLAFLSCAGHVQSNRSNHINEFAPW